MLTERWRALLAGACPLLLFAVLYGPVLLASSGLAPASQDADFFLYYFPLTQAAFTQWREHGFPEWNPLIYSGMPMALSMEVGLLYPPNWLHLVLPTERAFCLLYALHILLAGLGTWWYVRGRGRGPAAAAVSTMTYAFAASTILHFDMGLTSLVYSSAWLPLLFALIDRGLHQPGAGCFAGLVLALACQFLAGFPMYTLYLAVLIPAYLLWFGVRWEAPLSRRTLSLLVTFGSAAVLALGLVLPQLWPAWEVLQYVHREQLGYHQATHCSFPLPNLLTFLAPRFLGDDRACPYWGEVEFFDTNAWCGTIALGLAGLALTRWRERETLFWMGAVAVAIGLALGKDSPLYDVCYLLLPGVDRFRGIARLMIFANLGVAILAGIGFEQAAVHSTSRSVSRMLALIAGVALLLAALAAGMLTIEGHHVWWELFFDWVRRPGRELNFHVVGPQKLDILRRGFAVMRQNLLESAALLAAVAILLRITFWKPAFRQTALLLTLTALCVELYLFHRDRIVLTETRPWGEVAQRLRAALPDDDEPFRLAYFSRNPSILPNRLLYERLEDVGGHENFVGGRYSHFIHAALGIDFDQHSYLTFPNTAGCYDLLNVKYYLLSRKQAPSAGDTLLRSDVMDVAGHSFDLYQNNSVLPRAYLVHDVALFDSLHHCLANAPQDILERMRRQAFVEGRLSAMPEPLPETGIARESVRVTRQTPGRLELEIECAAPAFLVCIENYHPGWQAEVDGRPVPVYPANIFMTGISVPAGNHRVTLTYRSAGFRTGLAAAACSATLLILVCVVLVWLRRRNPPAAGNRLLG